MTLTPVVGPFWPDPIGNGAFAEYGMTTAATRQGFVVAAPRAGTIDRVCFRTATVTTAAALRVRLETINASGNPSGTLLAVGSEGSVAVPASATWYEVTLTTPVVVTEGQVFTVIIDPNGAASVNVAIAKLSSLPVSLTFPYMPASSSTGSSWNKDPGGCVTALRYNDGSYYHMPFVWPISTASGNTFGNASTPDERGNLFTVPVEMEVEGVWLGVTASTANFDIVIYEGATTLHTTSVTGVQHTNVGNTIRTVRLGGRVTLTPGTQYRVTMKPTTASSVTLRHIGWETAVENALPGGNYMKRTTRTDGGAWTDTDNFREDIGFILSQIDDGAGGGGGPTGLYKAKVGGTFVDVL